MAYVSSNQREFIPIVMLLKRLKMKGVWKGSITRGEHNSSPLKLIEKTFYV